LPMMNLEVDGFFRERTLLLKLTNNLAKPWNMWLKRGCDLLLGGALACFMIPLYVAIALLVKLDSPGPIFFRQIRLGFRDSLFQCFKFRTMYTDADERLEKYLESNPEARNELLAYAKLRNFDPRVTRIGRFLRTWSLDELPQLFNVLKGDMSLVGPRPYLPAERSRMGVHLPTILSARPGISGLWQVNGRNHLTFETRVQLEEWYVRHWGIWLDCIVLIKTLKAVLFSDTTQEQLEWDPYSEDSAELGHRLGPDGWENSGSTVHEHV
jgi:Undecaprenyl-phosphate galactose phosphotransferase WbaP